MLETLQTDNPNLPAARQALSNAKSLIDQAIASEFSLMPVRVGDRDAIIMSVEVDDVQHQQEFVVDADLTSVTFSIDAGISFHAELQEVEPPAASPFYDRDLHGALHRRPRSESESADAAWGYETFTVVGSISWENGDPDAIHDPIVGLANPRDVILYVDDYYAS